MLYTNPDREDIRDMRDHILHICEKLHIPVLKARCEKDGVWFYDNMSERAPVFRRRKKVN